MPNQKEKTSIIIANSKGGTGKTTISLMLAEYFNKIKNKKTIIIDLDYQQVNACQYFADQKTLINMKETSLYSIVNFIIENKEPLLTNDIKVINRLTDLIFQSIIFEQISDTENETTKDNLDFGVIASNSYIRDLNSKILGDTTLNTLIFKQLKNILYNFFDVIIIDTPPEVEFSLVQSAMASVENLLIVTDVGEFGVIGIDKLLSMYKSNKYVFNQNFNLIGILVNRYKTTNMDEDFMSTLEIIYEDMLIPYPILDYVDYRQSILNRTFILSNEYKPTNKKAKENIKQVFEEINKRTKWINREV